jgi:hypothetical protein
MHSGCQSILMGASRPSSNIQMSSPKNRVLPLLILPPVDSNERGRIKFHALEREQELLRSRASTISGHEGETSQPAD